MGKTASSPPRRRADPGAGSGAQGEGPERRSVRPPGLAGLLGTARRGGPSAGRSGRRPSGKAVVFAAVGITIVAVLAWALLGSRLLVVRSVQVVGGGRAVPAAQVLAAAHVRHGMPLIRVNTGAIARQVEQLRQVQSVQVSKDWPSTVVITVTPRTPVFAVRVPGGYALVGRFGVSIRDVAARPAVLPLLIVSAGTTLRASPAVRAAALVLTELPPRAAGQVRSVSAPGPAEVSVTLADRSVVVWGQGEGQRTHCADAPARAQLRRQRPGNRDGVRLKPGVPGVVLPGQHCELRRSRLRRRVAATAGAGTVTRTCLVLARGELTLHPGDPTVRINRHHNITLNLRLRVRVFDSRESWNCLAAAAGAHFSGLHARPVPCVSGSTGLT